MRIGLKLKVIYLLLLPVILSSCNVRNTYTKRRSFDDWTAQEAKLYDVPVLINARPEKTNQLVGDQLSSVASVLYTADSSLDDAMVFYEQEMERYGWDLVTAFVTQEILLIFQKPSKICSISIRPNKYGIKVVIYCQQKD